jgi:hypothetical protein
MWAIRRGAIAKVDLPARDRDLVGLPVDINARTEAARRLLHAPGISSSDRLAGALVVLSRITRLTVDDVDLADDTAACGSAKARCSSTRRSPTTSARRSPPAAHRPPRR